MTFLSCGRVTARRLISKISIFAAMENHALKVVVIGGGAAGFFAALSACKQEGYGFLGAGGIFSLHWEAA